MAALDTILAEMDSFLKSVWRDASAADVKKVNLVINTRRKILDQVAALHAAIGTDEKLKANPALATEFADRLTKLRQALAQLNSKWRLPELTANFEAYSIESRPTAEACAEFVRWAQSARTRVDPLQPGPLSGTEG